MRLHVRQASAFYFTVLIVTASLTQVFANLAVAPVASPATFPTLSSPTTQTFTKNELQQPNIYEENAAQAQAEAQTQAQYILSHLEAMSRESASEVVSDDDHQQELILETKKSPAHLEGIPPQHYSAPPSDESQQPEILIIPFEPQEQEHESETIVISSLEQGHTNVPQDKTDGYPSSWAELFQWAVRHTHDDTGASRPEQQQQQEGKDFEQQIHEIPSLQNTHMKALPERQSQPQKDLPSQKHFMSWDQLPEFETEFDQMRHAINFLSNESIHDPQPFLQALELLEELCHGLDNGNDLILLEGYKVLLRLINTYHADLSAPAAGVLAICSQNNPNVQSHLHDLNALDTVLRFLSHSHRNSDTSAKAKALLLLATLAENKDNLHSLTNNDKQNLLHILHTALLQQDDQEGKRLIRRSLFIAETLLRYANTWSDLFKQIGLVENAFNLVHHNDVDIQEMAARFIHAYQNQHTNAN